MHYNSSQTMQLTVFPTLLFSAAAAMQPEANFVPRIENTHYLYDNNQSTTTEYVYDADGRVLSSLTSSMVDGRRDQPLSKVEYQYDALQPDFCIYKMCFDYRNGQWVPVSGGRRISLTYNNSKQVTKAEIEEYNYYASDFEPSQRISITYSAANQPSKLVAEDYDSSTGQWGTSQTVTDMVWEEYTGKLPDFTEMTNIFGNGNKLKSAKLNMSIDADLQAKGTVSVSYPDELGSYVCNVNLAAAFNMVTAKATMKHTVVDENGSFNDESSQTVTIMGTGAESEYEKLQHTYDSHGFLLREYSEAGIPGAGNIPDTRLTQRVPEYDPEQNTLKAYDQYELRELAVEPSEATIDDLTHTLRVEFYEYYSPASAPEVSASHPQSVKYYDLRGRQIAKPALPGIYIKQQGSQTEKIKL